MATKKKSNIDYIVIYEDGEGIGYGGTLEEAYDSLEKSYGVDIDKKECEFFKVRAVEVKFIIKEVEASIENQC